MSLKLRAVAFTVAFALIAVAQFVVSVRAAAGPCPPGDYGC